MKRTLTTTALAVGLAAGALAIGGAPAFAGGSSHGDDSHHGRTHVVKPGESIQDAVDHAKPGDTIKLLKGHYDGGIHVTKNGITITGKGRDTVITPGSSPNNCSDDGEISGICVGGETTTVRGVTVEKLTVKGFNGFGVVGFNTDKLTVEHVTSINNLEYGITEFASTRGRFAYNWITGTSKEAGLYVGDIADARGTLVIGNHVDKSALGILVRHAHNVKVVDNEFTDNCTGIALVDDGQAGGMGDNKVADNTANRNNRFCAASDEAPALQGSGIVLVGGQRNRIVGNTVIGNRGTGVAPFSGGIVLVPGLPPTNTPGSGNVVTRNTVLKNAPFDIIDHNGGTDRIFDNKCRTSDPAGLCGHEDCR